MFVTGASSGLGLALALATPFSARIISISRSGPPPDSGIDHMRHDLSDTSGWPVVVDEIRQTIRNAAPSRSTFIHAAGTLTPIGFAAEVRLDTYVNNVLLNSAAGQVLGQGYLSAIRGSSGRHDLVMITSGAARSVYLGWSAYGAGKAALDHWVRIVGEEQDRRGGIRVMGIAPGVVATGMQEQIRNTSPDDFPDVGRFHELYEQGELASPEDAASKIWNVLESDVESGSVVDVRDL